MAPHTFLYRFVVSFLLSRSAGSRKNHATNKITRCHTAVLHLSLECSVQVAWSPFSKFALKTGCSPEAECIQRKSMRLSLCVRACHALYLFPAFVPSKHATLPNP
jgi:hypothetical protein